jgi:hypothetical protein
MLSPTNAPVLAQRITKRRFRSPELATTPPVMTAVSLGTMGKNASIADTAKIAA